MKRIILTLGLMLVTIFVYTGCQDRHAIKPPTSDEIILTNATLENEISTTVEEVDKTNSQSVVTFNKPIMQLKINDFSHAFLDQYTYEFNPGNQDTQTFQKVAGDNNSSVDTFASVIIDAASIMQITFDQQPDTILQNIYNGKTLVSTNAVNEGKLMTPSEEGSYTIELVCRWKPSKTRNFLGTATNSFIITVDSPTSFMLNHTTVYPGDTFAVLVTGLNEGEVFDVKAPFYEKEIKFYPYENGFVGLIPVYAWLTPGSYQIETSSDSSPPVTIEVEVAPKTFDIQHLIVEESTAAIMTNDNAAKDQVHFDRSKAKPIQEKLWEGPFIQPVDGVISTDYSSTRYTNDNPTPTRHLAIDIANEIGTIVHAANKGKVVLAMKLITTGNTVVLDHGMGLFTSYFHMDELLVMEGDTVLQGDNIGKMGTTGYSTGSHLHFSAWKDGTFLNPWTLIAQDPIRFN